MARGGREDGKVPPLQAKYQSQEQIRLLGEAVLDQWPLTGEEGLEQAQAGEIKPLTPEAAKACRTVFPRSEQSPASIEKQDSSSSSSSWMDWFASGMLNCFREETRVLNSRQLAELELLRLMAEVEDSDVDGIVSFRSDGVNVARNLGSIPLAVPEVRLTGIRASSLCSCFRPKDKPKSEHRVKFEGAQTDIRFEV